jgi:hypothetical protein
MEIEPDEIDGDIYDEIASLEALEASLSDLFAHNDITQEEFDSEMLKVRYYLDIKTKTYVLDEESSKIIEELRKLKKSLIENYKYSIIDEDEFNLKYNNVLRKEYEILKISEDDSDTSKSILIDMDTPLKDKLLQIHDEETKFNKSVAKKHGIKLPILPTSITKDEIDIYYDLKITNSLTEINEDIEEYIKKYSAAKLMIDYHTSSFEIIKIFYSEQDKKPMFKFKMVPALRSGDEGLKTQEKRGNLLTPEENAYSDRLLNIKDRMRQMSREDLIKCAGARTVRFMSYIEKLKENKQKVIKFKQNPGNYELLKKIVEEDNVRYYKIPSDLLFKQYTYTRPEIFNVSEENDNSVVYVEAGNTAYLAIKPGADLKNLRDSDFEPVLPLADELIKYIKEDGSNSYISEAWQLRMSLPGSSAKNIIKRYLSFDDYLEDLMNILKENAISLPERSRDILKAKIKKINYYLMYKEDIEVYSSTGHSAISELFKNKKDIFDNRQRGLYQLLEIFTKYYPTSDLMVEKIENDIFEYSSSKYKFNIPKVLFLLNNYQNKLVEIIDGTETIINLLNYETPLTLPEQDVTIGDDKQESIDKLLSWKPNTENYERYSNDLKTIKYSFSEFKKIHTELSSLEISQIMNEYTESILWKRSLSNYRNLNVPDGAIELNFRLRYLLKHRNKLPSRRVFRLASISERIDIQNRLNSTFLNECKINKSREYAILTENIIYGLSVNNEDYLYYNKIVNQEYKKLCEYFTQDNVKFEPNIITFITEFIVKQGDFKTVDIQRLNIFTSSIDDNKILSYIKNLRGREIDAYSNSLIERTNSQTMSLPEIFLKASRIMKSAKYAKQLENLRIIAYNTYKPPIVSVEKPIKNNLGTNFIQNYININDYYVYGGFYPQFYMFDDNGDILKENYTRSDLEKLAGILNLETEEDSFELYVKIMNTLSDFNKQPIPVFKNFTPEAPKRYQEYLITPNKSINYFIRPRIGVKEPGEVYTVIKDSYKSYGVPFSYNENTIPIYSADLKARVDNGFIIIEGPCIFQETTQESVVSDSYINIEYRDDRGKTKLFKEGVAPKKIQKRKLENLKTCERFSTQENCDDINSYSLDVGGIKLKCKWIQERCKEVEQISTDVDKFDMTVSFKNFNTNKLWKTAIDKSMRYVEDLIKIKELSRDEIEIITKEQKNRLFNYYTQLNEISFKPKLPTLEEEKTEVRTYSLVDKFADILGPVNVVKKSKSVVQDYSEFTVYSMKSSQMTLPSKRVILNKEYIVNGNVVTPIEFNKDDNSYTCNVKDGDDIILHTSEFRSKSNEIIVKKTPMFCLVKNEDLLLITDFPGYFWFEKNKIYTKEDSQIVTTVQTNKRYFVPSNFITPTGLLNGKPLISKGDIFSAMYKTAFNTLIADGDFIYTVVEKINATDESIKFAIDNKVDIIQLSSKIVGTIGILHVIEEYESKNPKKTTTKQAITKIISDAINAKDKKTLMSNYVIAKKNKIDRSLLEKAKELIKEPDEIISEPLPVPVPVPITSAPIIGSVYTPRRRR